MTLSSLGTFAVENETSNFNSVNSQVAYASGFRVQVLTPNGTPYTGVVVYSLIKKENNSTAYPNYKRQIYDGNLVLSYSDFNGAKPDLAELYVYPLDASYGNSIKIDVTDCFGKTSADLGTLSFQEPVTTGTVYNTNEKSEDTIRLNYANGPGVDETRYMLLSNENTFAAAPFIIGPYEKVEILIRELDRNEFFETYTYNRKDIEINMTDEEYHTATILTPDGSSYTGQVEVCIYVQHNTWEVYVNDLVDAVNGKIEFQIPSHVDETYFAVFHPLDGSYGNSVKIPFEGYDCSSPAVDLGNVKFQKPTFTGRIYNNGDDELNVQVTATFKKEGKPDMEVPWRFFYTNSFAFAPFDSSYDETVVFKHNSNPYYEKTFAYDAQYIDFDVTESKKDLYFQVKDPDGNLYNGEAILMLIDGNNFEEIVVSIVNGNGSFDIEKNYKEMYILPNNNLFANTLIQDITSFTDGDYIGSFQFQNPLTTGKVLIDDTPMVNQKVSIDYRNEIAVEIEVYTDSQGRFSVAPTYEGEYLQVGIMVDPDGLYLRTDVYDISKTYIEVKYHTDDRSVKAMINDSEGQPFTGEVLFNQMNTESDSYKTSIENIIDGVFEKKIIDVYEYTEFYFTPKGTDDADSKIYMMDNFINGVFDVGTVSLQKPVTIGRIIKNGEPIKGSVSAMYGGSDYKNWNAVLDENGGFKFAPLYDFNLSTVVIGCYDSEGGAIQYLEFNATDTDLVFDLDTITESLTPNGGTEVTVEVHSNYIDPGAIYMRGAFTREIDTEDQFDINTLGDYFLKYAASDLEVGKTIHVVDTTAPTITLKGDKTIEINENTTFDEPGYIVSDNYSDAIISVAVEGLLDITKPGTYKLTYTAEDRSGNKSNPVERTVVVKEVAPVTPPATPPAASVTPPAAPAVSVVPSITLSETTIELEVGTDADVTSFKLEATGSNVIWSSSNEDIVTVLNGLVTAVSEGEAVVKATEDTLTASCNVIVYPVGEEKTPLGALKHSYISGYTDGTFRPDNNITRAEIATVISNMLNLNLDYPASQKFDDVSNKHWAYKYVQAIERTGIFAGYPDGNFGPDDNITRLQISQVVLNLMNYLDLDVKLEDNSTVVDVWAQKAVNNLLNNSYQLAFKEKDFLPNVELLRGEMIYIMNRVLDIDPDSPEAPTFNDVPKKHRFYGDIEAASEFIE